MRPQFFGTRGPRHGFSLMELMITLSIMGVVLAVAIPSFVARNSRYHTQGAAQDMAARFQLARQMAVNSRVTYRAVLDPARREYTFQRRETDSTWVDYPAETYEAAGVDTMSAVVGAHGGGGDDIEFQPGGTIAAADSPALIRFIHLGDTTTVKLVRTGRVTVACGGTQ
jgi:type IV fimbrial biogenesis protein FimT